MTSWRAGHAARSRVGRRWVAAARPLALPGGGSQLSALLGNLAYHPDDRAGARTHLTLAGALGESTREPVLTAWASGALAMVATARQDWEHAPRHIEYGLHHAPEGLRRAQLLGWALLPVPAATGRTAEADGVLDESDAIMRTAVELPGRCGYDRAEHRSHVVEAHLTLERFYRAAAVALESIDAAPAETPGWWPPPSSLRSRRPVTLRTRRPPARWACST